LIAGSASVIEKVFQRMANIVTLKPMAANK